MRITRRQSVGLIGAGALTGPALLHAQSAGEVIVFEASRIVTMEPSLPSARFVAVSGGMILGVADTLDELAPWTKGQQVKVDRRYANKVMMPGLVDPHVHPMQAAVMLNLPFIAPDDWSLPTGEFPGTRTPKAWRERFAQVYAQSSADPFICWGYHELFHGPLDRKELDRLAPDRAAIVWQRSFHEIIVNTRALKLWGLDDGATFDAALKAIKADPTHADFDRGLLSETALMLGLSKLRPAIFSPVAVSRGAQLMLKMLATNGVTTVSDMATGIFASFDDEAALIRMTFNSSKSAARVMLMPIASAVPEGDPVAWLEGKRARYGGPRVRVDRRAKLFADGAFFSQNMRMNPPGYTDGHVGKWLTEPPVLAALAQKFWAAGFSLHVHVNGDEGLDVVLDIAAQLDRRRMQTITLEHLGYSTERQNERIATLGLMVSAQPNYIRVLGDAYAAHGLGVDRAAVMNRLGSLERKGVPLGLHSDFNMAPIDPLYLAWVAASRETIGGHVKAPDERLSVAKALRAITIEAAQVIGMDAIVGSIAPGKRADFAVLDRDPHEGGVDGLRGLKVSAVVFEGKPVES